MGLFWSLVSETGVCAGVQRRHKDVTTPYHFILYVLACHIKVDATVLRTLDQYTNMEIPANGCILTNGQASDITSPDRGCQLLAQASLWRFFLTPDVLRVPVKEGRIRGILFVPNRKWEE